MILLTGNHRAAHERHIVVCSTALQYDLIFDFLNEFYAHRKNQVKFLIKRLFFKKSK